MGQTPEKLTQELKRVYGENLKSVVLYGSAASGDYDENFSDFNILVVVERFDVAQFKKTAKTMRAWTRAGNPPPLMFTWDRLQKSEDVFPIELMEMKENHRVLFGDDPFTNLEIRSNNFRLELERELKSNLIKLRERFLLTADTPKKVQQLLVEANSTFLILFRNVLRLKGVSPLPSKKDTPQFLSEQMPVDLTLFDYIEALKGKEKTALKENPDVRMESFLKLIEQVVDTVDTYEKNA